MQQAWPLRPDRRGRDQAAHVPLDQAGTAAFTTSALPDGLRRIVVDYQGDVRYAKATAQIEQSVTATLASAVPRM